MWWEMFFGVYVSDHLKDSYEIHGMNFLLNFLFLVPVINTYLKGLASLVRRK